jgi:hypothetical protein
MNLSSAEKSCGSPKHTYHSRWELTEREREREAGIYPYLGATVSSELESVGSMG